MKKLVENCKGYCSLTSTSSISFRFDMEVDLGYVLHLSSIWYTHELSHDHIVMMHGLVQMERTVEIDENSAILNDLERLKSGPLDSMLGSTDAGNREEGSPDGSSTIALQGGSNPLEQLGLFMRDDEDDDDEYNDKPHDEEDEEMDGDSALVTKKEVAAAGDEEETVDVEDVEDGEIDVD